MAQTNYTPIQLYSSSTATNMPLAANLAAGELAINTADGILFYKDSSNVVQKIGYKLTPTTAGGTGLTSFTANGVVYASSTSALATGSALVFNGTNLGLGVTPSAWSVGKAFELTNPGNGLFCNAASTNRVVSNAYFQSSWKYGTGSFAASRYDQNAGSHSWYTAPVGTSAGDAITFTQAMTLLANGNLGVTETNPGAKLQVNTGAAGTVGQIILMAASQTADVLRVTRSDTNLSLQFTPTGQLSIGDIAATASTVITTGPSTSTNANLKVSASNAGNPNLILQSFNGAGGGIGGPTSFVYFGDNNRALSYIGGTKVNAFALNASSDLVFGTTPDISTTAVTERMRLDSSGNLGIGTSSPSTKLHLQDNSAVYIQMTDVGDGASRIGQNGTALTFGVDSANGSTERARFNSTGAFVFAGGTTSANGIGITFPATQSASSNANTLDDYEEGTWTPTQGAGLTVVGAFSSEGRYTKIGRLVYIWGKIAGATSIATTAGTIMFGSAPFSAAEVSPIGVMNTDNRNVLGGFSVFGTTGYSETTLAANPAIYFNMTYTV